MNHDYILQLEDIHKRFGDTQVLNGIDLQVRQGEFITLLGSSGCGKTTTLRIIAGLETPDEGRVLLEGKDMARTEPNKRDVNTVFQNYALFPHMNVEQNVGYALKIRRRDKEEIRSEVKRMLELVQLEGFEKRMPSELSGGQRQRVAIARAVINQPKLLLLDEPLGALDLQLRRQMQQELKRLQKKLGLTFIYITHDQEEALNMSDRIAVMKDGRFQQVGTPGEVYDSPGPPTWPSSWAPPTLSGAGPGSGPGKGCPLRTRTAGESSSPGGRPSPPATRWCWPSGGSRPRWSGPPAARRAPAFTAP